MSRRERNTRKRKEGRSQRTSLFFILVELEERERDGEETEEK
jgi:hypothetical protein